jgi:signal transduction histidine kinase/sensor domain CHASE-containing protein
MSIVRRTVLMVIITSLVLFLLVYFISNVIYIKGFEELERKTVAKNTTQVTDALSVQMNSLDAFCEDWSSWDDTYNFAKDSNQTYIDRNLMDDTFTGSDIGLLLVLNTSGGIVYGKAYDIANQQEMALPADLPASLPGGGLLNPLDMVYGISGIIMSNGQAMIISEKPILNSLNEGPSTGFLVVGRFLDTAAISSLSKTTGLAIDLLLMESVNQNQELSSVVKTLSSPDTIYIKIQKGNLIAGYTLERDLSGDPAFVFKVSIPRDIYSQGQNTVSYLHLSLLGFIIIFCVVFILLAQKLILTRLTTLSNAVNAIGSKGDASSRISVEGQDELSRLAGNINSMLESLQTSEHRRHSQRELISHIIANTPVAVLAIDESDYIMLFNDALRKMFDLGDTGILGTNITVISNLSLPAAELKAFKESGAYSFKKELQYVQNNYTKTLIAAFARLKEEERYILYLTDITEERAKQESLYLTDRLASIGEMASGIAHELNNPLTSIIGLSEMVAMEKVAEVVKEDMGIIKSESQRAAEIVKNLLSFARKTNARKQPASINKIIMDVLRLRSYEHGVNNITVVRELDPNLPEIVADASQLQQVFINIILNAEHAMVTAHGKGKLKIKTETAGAIVKISFTDDGPGIMPENLRRIFDPFFTTKEVGKGTGLGLSISYGIVTDHNGLIYATSEPGKGATFVIELPVDNPETKETN